MFQRAVGAKPDFQYWGDIGAILGLGLGFRVDIGAILGQWKRKWKLLQWSLFSLLG